MSLFKKSPNRGAPGHGKGYKYKKRFNAAVSVNLGGAKLPSNPDSFEGTYGGGGRPQVQLDSIVITEGDTYGHLTQVEVTFTCFTIGAFSKYAASAFKLGANASVSVGYAESGAPSGGKTFSELMIYKYNWTTTKDNYVRCSVSCMSATPLINQADVNVSAKLGDANLKFMDVLEVGGPGVATPVQTISQLMKYQAQGGGGTPTKDVPDGFYNGVLVITNPGVSQGDADEQTKKVLEIMAAAGIPVSFDNAKLVYCTLEWFVQQINTYYIPNEGKLAGITYEFDETATAAGCLSGICSADPLNILIAGGGAGDYGAAADVPDEQKLLAESKASAPPAISGNTINCKNILLSSSYIASTVFGAASKTENAPDKAITPDNGQPAKVVYSIGQMFEKIFQDIVSATGGNIHLATLPGKNKKMLICAYNHNDGSGISPAVFDPISGNQAIRLCEVSCAPGSSDAYAIAVLNRKSDGAGPQGANGQDVQGDPGNAAQAIRDAREKGLVQEKFSAASIAGLKEQLGKLVNNASSDDASSGKIPHQYGQFPLNLQVTMDGCVGWEFGDAITVSFLPGYQKGGKGVFIVQKIIHTIATNDWETKLETVFTII